MKKKLMVFLLSFSFWIFPIPAKSNELDQKKENPDIMWMDGLLDFHYLGPGLAALRLIRAESTVKIAKFFLKTTQEEFGIAQAKAWKMRTTQALASLAVLEDIRNSKNKKGWDLESVLNQTWSLTSIGLWATGYAVPHLWIPSAIYATYKIPVVRTSVDEKIYGQYLNEARDVFDATEFDEPLISRPYLICNYYSDVSDLAKGNRPEYWSYVTKEDHFKGLEEDAISKERFYATYKHKGVYKGLQKNFLVVAGRWLKISTGYWEHSIRFATQESPVELQLICNQVMMKSGKIKNPDDEKRVVPQVGYSDITLSYPIYFYLSNIATLSDGSQVRIAKKLSVSGVPDQKMQRESGDYIEDIMQSIKISKYVYASWDNTALKWVTGKVPGAWNLVDEIDAPYDIYKLLWRKYQKGEEVSYNDALGVGLKVAASGEAVYKFMKGVESVPYLSYVHHVRAFYFLLNGGVAVSPHVSSFVSEKVFGPYLKDSTSFSKDDFDDKKLNKAYLQCRYFEDEEKMKANMPLYWNWAPSVSLDEATDKIPSQTEQVAKHIRLRGRWMKVANPDKKESYNAFATLEDPVRLLATCQRALAHDYEDGLLDSKKKKS